MTSFKRHRTLRSTPWIRDLISESSLSPKDFILPLFITNENEPVYGASSTANITRHSFKSALSTLEQAIKLGIKAVFLFPVIPNDCKNNTGSHALEENLLVQFLNVAKEYKFPLSFCVDIALDPYTNHGHDGIIQSHGDTFYVDNDATNETLAQMAVHFARAGADVLCPSDMMDGRIDEFKKAFSAANLHSKAVFSYAAKYASCLYGPFRQMVGAKKLQGLEDKKTYQMDPRNSNEALSEISHDEQEGADALIIKPGLAYLDILAKAHQKTTLPLLAYQVSGEYAMIKLAAKEGVFSEQDAFLETAYAFKRAGARSIITYAALELAQWVNTTQI